MKMKLFNRAFPVFLSEDGGDWESFSVDEYAFHCCLGNHDRMRMFCTAKKVMFDGFAGVAPGVAGPRRNGYGNAYN